MHQESHDIYGDWVSHCRSVNIPTHSSVNIPTYKLVNWPTNNHINIPSKYLSIYPLIQLINVPPNTLYRHQVSWSVRTKAALTPAEKLAIRNMLTDAAMDR